MIGEVVNTENTCKLLVKYGKKTNRYQRHYSAWLIASYLDRDENPFGGPTEVSEQGNEIG